jgi:hypothetical protein
MKLDQLLNPGLYKLPVTVVSIWLNARKYNLVKTWEKERQGFTYRWQDDRAQDVSRPYYDEDSARVHFGEWLSL